MSNKLTKDEAQKLAKDFLEKVCNRFKQEIIGENEEFLDRVLNQHCAKVCRSSWKVSQKCCKWNDEGPVLMPDQTKLYYRKGKIEVLVMEHAPQIRLMKFKGSLSHRNNTSEQIAAEESDKIHHYSLALPYVVFMFKYVDGVFVDLFCAFSDRPLKKLDEKPYLPYMSNINNTLKVCLGRSFDTSELIKGNIVQQAALVLNHFWHTIYSDEWSQNFWDNKNHFHNIQDKRLMTMQAWQDASIENPLFVIEDVNWIACQQESFGDIILRMFSDDAISAEFSQELYKELVDEFMNEVNATLKENFDSVQNKMINDLSVQLSEEFVSKISE